jgi:hypothetical protein
MIQRRLNADAVPDAEINAFFDVAVAAVAVTAVVAVEQSSQSLYECKRFHPFSFPAIV